MAEGRKPATSRQLLAVLVLAFVGIAQLSISNWWGLLNLAAAFAIVPFSLWVFTTAAKGWPVRRALTGIVRREEEAKTFR